eukprot:m.310617 g.310617  ORF g.310617 m.310617 type:complete len:495 (+) comp25585_c0_seq1:122-1606(+)
MQPTVLANAAELAAAALAAVPANWRGLVRAAGSPRAGLAMTRAWIAAQPTPLDWWPLLQVLEAPLFFLQHDSDSAASNAPSIQSCLCGTAFSRQTRWVLAAVLREACPTLSPDVAAAAARCASSLEDSLWAPLDITRQARLAAALANAVPALQLPALPASPASDNHMMQSRFKDRLHDKSAAAVCVDDGANEKDGDAGRDEDGDEDSAALAPSQHSLPSQSQRKRRRTQLPPSDEPQASEPSSEARSLFSLLEARWKSNEMAPEADIRALDALPDSALTALSDVTGFSDMAEDHLAALCDSLMQSDGTLRFATCKALFGATLKPWLTSLSRTISRRLLASLTRLGKRHPLALQEALLAPVLSQPTMSTAQKDAIGRLAKACLSVPEQAHLIEITWSSPPEAAFGEALICEEHIDLLLTLLEPGMDQSALVIVARLLAESSLHFPKSLKMGKLLLHLATKLRPQLSPAAVDLLRAAVEPHHTFLKKKISSALAQA